MHRLLPLLAAGLFICFSGCQSDSESANQEPSIETKTASDEHSPLPIEVSIIDGPGLQAAIAAHRGKVVLVDFWATWCGPCIARFPHIVELAEMHDEQELVVISVSLDDPAEQEQVLQFLEQKQAHFQHFISEFGVSPKSADAFNFRGDVPFYHLYDRSGDLVNQFSPDVAGLKNGLPVEALDQRIAELLETE